MEYASIKDRVEVKTRDIKVSLYEALVAATLLDDALKVLELAQQLKEVYELQDIEKLVELVNEHSIPADRLNEFVKSYIFGGDYDDIFIGLKRESELEDSYDNQV